MADAQMLVSIVGQQTVTPAANAAASSLGMIESAAQKGLGALTGLASAAIKATAAVAAIGAGAAVAGMASSINVAKSFEQQISAVAAVSGATAAELKTLSDLALQLGKDTSFSATEAAQGLEELVKAGVSLSDIMGGAAKASLDLAAAGGVSVADAAEIAANALNVFNLSGKDMAMVADTIAGAANASAISVNDYKFSLASSGAAAKLAGVDFRDLSTAIALMGQSGIKGSDAGTSLKTMFLNLQPSTKAQKEAFKELGLITESGANAFFDATGKAKSLAEISGILQNATKHMTQQQKLATLEVLFGSDAIRAAAILTEAGAEGFNEMAAAMGNVAASDVAETRLDNLAGSLEKLAGTWETVRIKIGQPFLPILKRAVDELTGALNEAEPAISAYAEAAAAWFDGFLTRGRQAMPSMLAMGSAALVMGRNLMSMAQGALPLVVREFDRLRSLFAAGGGTSGLLGAVERIRSTFTALAPVALAVGRAVADNVVATFTFLSQRVLPPVLSILGQTAGIVERTLLPAFAATGAVMRGIFGDTLDWLARTVWPPFLSIVEQTSDFFTSTILPTLPAVGASLRTALGETVQWLATDVWPKLRTAATAAWGFISGTIVPALPGLARQLRTMLGGALEWIGTTGWPMLVSAGQAAAAWITGTAVPAISRLADWLGPKISAALSWLSDTGWPMLVSAGEAVSSWVMGTAVPALSQLWDWLSPKLAAALQWLTDTGWPTIVSAGSAASSWFMDTLVPALSAAWDWLSPKLQAAAQWFIDTGWPTLVSTGESVSGWFMDTLVPALTSAWDWLEPKLQTAISWLYDTGFPAMVTEGQKVITMWEDMNKWMTDVWTQLKDTQIWDNLTAAMGKLWDAGKILVETFWPQTKTGAQEATDTVGPFVKLIEGASEVVYYFAAGVEAIAKALAAIKEAASGLNLPPWLIDAIRGATPAVPGLPGSPSILDPILPSGRTQTGLPTGGGNYGPIDNSSRASFVRTAYPYMLEAAGGDKNLAEMMLAAAISENGDVGSGGDFIGNNFFGIKGTGTAGSFNAATWEQINGQRVNIRDNFAAYNTPQEGFRAFMQFLEENPRYAGALQQYQQSGDAEELFQNINRAGYATDTNWGSTIANIRRNQVAPVTAGINIPMMSAATSAQRVNLGQTQQQWANMASDANAICGPYLASLFASAVGRPPTADEARQMAEAYGIYSGAGSGSGILNAQGFDEFATSMIRQLNPGSMASVTQTEGLNNAQAAALASQSLAGGAPIVGFNTSGHYFGADAYDPNTGKFRVGGTGLSLRGGAEWMTVDEMTAAMGPLVGVLQLVGVEGERAGAAMAPLGSTLNDTKGAAESAAGGFATATDAMAPLGETANETKGAVSEMAAQALTSVTHMGDGIMTVITDTAGNTTTTMTDLAGNVTSQITQMADGTVLTFGDMQNGILTSTTNLGDGVMTVVQDMSGNYITTITDLAGNVVNQYVQMASGASTHTALMAQTTAEQTTAMHDGTITTIADMVGQSSGFLTALGDTSKEQFGAVSTAAISTAEPIGAVSDSLSSIEPPDAGPIVSAFGQIRSAARDTTKELERVRSTIRDISEASKGGSKSGSGDTGLGKRASGGPVGPGMWLVGEQGPELLSLSAGAGYVYNAGQTRTMLDGRGGYDGGIDYSLMAKAIAAEIGPIIATTRPMQFVGTADEIASRVRREVRQERSLLTPRRSR